MSPDEPAQPAKSGRYFLSADKDSFSPSSVVLAAFAAIVLGAILDRTARNGHPLAYLAATGIGAVVGVTELVARYRDKPQAAVESLPGIAYIAVNAMVSLAVLWLLRTQQIRVIPPADLGNTLSQVLIAGVGSMALLRTSIFTLRVKDSDVAIGPAALLQVILDAVDRACDRLRAGPRAARVKQIMEGVSFLRAKSQLPYHCLALMQNISAAERNVLTQGVDALSSRQDLSDEVKAYNLGLLLMTYIGEDVLQQAVTALDTEIQGPPPDEPPILSQARQLAFADMKVLIAICTALDPVPRGPASSPAALSAGWLKVDDVLTQEPDKIAVVLIKLRRFFGPDTLSRGLALLKAGKQPPIKTTEPVTAADLK